MKTNIFSIIILSTFFATFSVAQDKDIEIVAKNAVTGRKLAVLVGIDNYEHLRTLECARRDVFLLRDSLYKIGFEKEDVICLTDGNSEEEKPTYGNILKTIQSVLDRVREGDMLFIALSGHGIQLTQEQIDDSRLTDQEKEGERLLQARFAAWDSDNSSVAKLARTTLSIPTIYEKVIRSQATYKLMLIDACRNAPTQRSDLSRSAYDIQAKSIDALPMPPKGIVLLQSCGEGEKSYEDPDYNHGIFTYYVAEGIAGKAASPNDGYVTLLRLASYASGKTVQRVRHLRQTGKIKGTQDQTPFLTGETADILIAEVPITAAHFPNDFIDLHLAIKRLGKGSTLTIGPGTHKITEPLIIDKDIQIVGATGDPTDVTLLSTGPGVMKVTAENARIQGLTLQVKAEKEKTAMEYAAVSITAGKSQFIKCHFTSDSGNGLCVSDGANPNVNNCMIRDCKGCGIIVSEKGKGTFEKCSIYENENSGIQVYDEGDPTMRDCKFYDGKSGGIFVYEKGKGTFEKCEIYRNTLSGIQVREESDPTVHDCKFYDGKEGGILVNVKGKGTFEKCSIYGNANAGIQVRDEGDPTVHDCKFYDGKASGIYVYEKGKGTFEKCSIYGNTLAGISVATEGDPTVRDCKFYDGNSCGIFVYEKGKGTFEKCSIYGNALSGIQVREEGDPTVRDCKFYDGKAGGIWVYEKGKGRFEKCEIYRNENSGIRVQEEGDPIVRDCKFYDGKAGGIFVYEKGKGRFEKCESYRNALAGIEVKTTGTPAVHDCKFYDGQQGGIFVQDKGKGTFEKCESYRNALAGIEVTTDGNPTVRDCKFYDGQQGGIFVHDKGKGRFEKCESYRNTLAGIQVKEEGDPTVRDCKFYDGKEGGIFVNEKGNGTFEKCESYRNTLTGIEVRGESDPTVWNCKIYDNKYACVYIHDKGEGAFYNNVLSCPNDRIWDIRESAGTVLRKGNTPNQ